MWVITIALLLVLVWQPADTPALLVLTDHEPARIRVIDVDQRDYSDVATWTENDYYYRDVGWSENGDYLWTVEQLAADVIEFYVYAAPTLEKTLITDQIYPDPCHAALSWAPGGRYLGYFSGILPDVQLNVRDMQTGDTYTLPYEPAPQGMSFRWSPDGEQFMLQPATGVSDEARSALYDAATGEILQTFAAHPSDTWFSPEGRYLLHKDRNTLRRYDFQTGEDTDVIGAEVYGWSPDGTHAALWQIQGEYRFGLYDVANNDFRAIELPGQTRDFGGWVDQGAAVLVVSAVSDNPSSNPTQTIWRYDVDSGELTEIVEVPGPFVRARTSPDTAWTAIAYNSESRKETADHLLLTDGSQTQIYDITIPNIQYTIPLYWSPDSRYLIVRSDDGIYHIDVSTMELEYVTRQGDTPGNVLWSGDGEHLAYNVYPAELEPGSYFSWSPRTKQVLLLPGHDELGLIIGWQDGPQQAQLLQCGMG